MEGLGGWRGSGAEVVREDRVEDGRTARRADVPRAVKAELS